mmetsp:Transcript_40521/g.134106  ORF Transcript_40521/g.134106 Transcript_40521/m.134106 type:complete len:234 (+) Transcript_40521:398-1099(+)
MPTRRQRAVEAGAPSPSRAHRKRGHAGLAARAGRGEGEADGLLLKVGRVGRAGGQVDREHDAHVVAERQGQRRVDRRSRRSVQHCDVHHASRVPLRRDLVVQRILRRPRRIAHRSRHRHAVDAAVLPSNGDAVDVLRLKEEVAVRLRKKCRPFSESGCAIMACHRQEEQKSGNGGNEWRCAAAPVTGAAAGDHQQQNLVASDRPPRLNANVPPPPRDSIEDCLSSQRLSVLPL